MQPNPHSKVKPAMRILLSLGLAAWMLAATAAAPELDLSQYRGKVVYLDFWASWCKPCRQSFPWMAAMQQKYAEDGLVIVAVNVDEQHADAEQFLRQTPAAFSVVYDSAGELAAQYQLIAMPSSFIIGRDGQVLVKHAGFYDDSPIKYEAEIRSALGTQ